MKRTGSIVLVLALLAALFAGCGGNTAPPESAASSAGGEAASSAASEAALAGERIEKFDPPITVTSVRTAPNPATQDYKDGDDAQNNAWTRRILEKYGIKLEYNWLAGSTEYDTKVSLMLSSGDLPDFFQAPVKQYSEMLDAGLLGPVENAWNTYASENTRNVIEGEGGPNVMKACAYDGVMMAIPFTGNPREGVPILYIRQDWLEKLNLSAPENLADIIAIAEAFATRDPDGNGAADTYALALDQTITGTAGALFFTHGAYPYNFVLGDDGLLKKDVASQGAKETLQLLADWYAKGWIDPEWFTKDYGKAAELVNNGKVGMTYGSFSTPVYPLQAGRDVDNSAEWLAVPAPARDGGLVKAPYSLGITGYWVASKEFEHPEAMVMMLNEWFDIFYYNTDPALHKELVNSDSGAEIWLNAPIMAYRGLKNMDCGLKITEYYGGKLTLDDMTPEQQTYISQIDAYQAGDQSMWCWNKIFGVDGAATLIKRFVDQDSYVFDQFWGTSTETMSTNGAIVDKLVSESYTAFITGQKSFDEWDSFARQYQDMGGDAIAQEVNAWYAENK